MFSGGTLHRKDNISIGKLGEDLAYEYLVNKGYQILDRNYRKPWGEIDIIGQAKDGTLVFFEVKTLKAPIGSEGLAPEDNLSAAKLKKLKRTCRAYADKYRELISDNKGWRIDLLALTIFGKSCDIKHYEHI